MHAGDSVDPHAYKRLEYAEMFSLTALYNSVGAYPLDVLLTRVRTRTLLTPYTNHTHHVVIVHVHVCI